MEPIDIQYELKKRGITQKQIAREEGRSEMSVSKVIRRESTSYPLAKAVSRRLGKKPEEVFPEYFPRNNNKNTRKAA